jgi:hypothetical protein
MSCAGRLQRVAGFMHPSATRLNRKATFHVERSVNFIHRCCPVVPGVTDPSGFLILFVDRAALI